MIDLTRLNDHSRRFAHLLFRQWPEWLRHARYDPWEDFEKEALLVEVPCPTDGSRHGLFITTSEWEIAIGFGADFHTRFGAGDGGPADFYAEALAFLDDFVEERCAIASARQDGQWLGAWRVDAGPQGPETPVVEDGVDLSLRSWRGTWDRDLPART
ncbi:MAG TPA: hypothetical protein PLQ13_09055 [Candidatus Krumholzibacteria bacterium]|nr:hypothetical protein [Candidatus Krumholzibacteria bacterium]